MFPQVGERGLPVGVPTQGRLETRLDGVLLFEAVPVPVGATRVGLLAQGAAEFGSFAVTNVESDE